MNVKSHESLNLHGWEQLRSLQSRTKWTFITAKYHRITFAELWYLTEYNLQRWEKYKNVNFQSIYSDNNQKRSKYISNKIQDITLRRFIHNNE